MLVGSVFPSVGMIGQEFDRMLRSSFRSACAACRVSTTRVDQSHLHESIWDEICDAIRSSDFLIAVATPDSTGVPNPNVMLEIGYARALHKPVLLLTNAPDALPFDFRTQRACVTGTRPLAVASSIASSCRLSPGSSRDAWPTEPPEGLTHSINFRERLIHYSGREDH